MRGEEPDPIQSLYFVDGVHQVCEVLGRLKVVSIRVDVLAEQRDFPYSPAHEHFRLVDQLLHRTTDLSATPVRDDAEAAELVAAVDDRDEG